MTEPSIRGRTELTVEHTVPVARAANPSRLGVVWGFPDRLRRFLLRKGGATVVLIGVCLLLLVAAAFQVPRADWGFAASLLVLLKKLFPR